ncbi:uncharacterized protein [Physcomitrium patens]|uniref:uncharacterized protein isoform X2 n=1 Tax=Physcomitrium patens TaxID=3218 RepID=UPI003CCD520B
MPRLREAQIPIGHKVYKNILKLLNVAVIIFGIMTVVMSFEINPVPTFSPGWLLILLGSTTMLGGFTGFGGTTLPCCYKSHIICMSIAIFGTAVFCLCMFGQRAKVVASFKSKRFSEETVDRYLSSICWLYIFVVIVECVALAARVIFQRKFIHEQFESLAQTQDLRAATLRTMREDLWNYQDGT